MLVDAANLLDALAQPALLLGRDRRVAAMNGGARELFGAQAIGRRYGISIRQPQLLDAIERAFDGAPQGETRVTLHTGDAGRRVFSLQIGRIGAGAEGAGLLLVLRDLTDVEANLKMRQDFVADVSHELKTPLSAMSGFLETILGPARSDTEMRERFIGLMKGEVERMVLLVEDLLHLARVERGPGAWRFEDVDPGEVLDSAVSVLRPQAEAAGLTLRVAARDNGARVRGDAAGLRQVVTNLLNNAILHAGATEITVGLGQGSASEVCLFVADDGHGIAPEHIPRLTERFYRIDDHRARQGKAGTGLGLSIVKHILLAHKARLNIVSAPGQGARFEVWLPRAQPS